MVGGIVIWKYKEKEEEKKNFHDFMKAMAFQRSLLKKNKKQQNLEYAQVVPTKK